MIRKFREEDIVQLKQIHEKFYKDEFLFVDFCSQFLDFFVVEEYGRIISAGGIRSIAESVIMTDKAMLSKTKVRALHQMLEAQMFTCGRLGYNQLHAFIQDIEWKKHLFRIGFKPCKGDAIFIEVK